MLKEEGMTLIEAAVAAAKLRLRPILMTSLPLLVVLSHWSLQLEQVRKLSMH